jgi:hypothetical protein
VSAAVTSPGDAIYATELAIHAGKKTKLLLTSLHIFGKGDYVLTFTHPRHRNAKRSRSPKRTPVPDPREASCQESGLRVIGT